MGSEPLRLKPLTAARRIWMNEGGDGATTWIATARPGRDFAIALRETDDVLGGISLFESEQHRRAALGYWVAIELWGRGYATEAVRAVIDYGFSWASTQQGSRGMPR